MLSYFCRIVLVTVVAQSIAFNLPNAISPPPSRTNHPSLMDATDASKVDYDLDNHASVNRDDAPTIRSVLTIDNRDVSSTTVEETKSIYEIYQSTHRTETTEIMNNQFEKWILKLFNDSDNTRSRVCQCLVRNVAGLSEEESYMKMMHAHKHGEAIIGEYCQEHAEYYKEALVGSGLVCDIFPVEE